MYDVFATVNERREHYSFCILVAFVYDPRGLDTDNHAGTFSELAKVNETRSHFENLSGSLSEALSKKASIHRNKVQELADAKNSL